MAPREIDPADLPHWLIRQALGLAFGVRVPDTWRVSVTDALPADVGAL